MSPRKPPHPRAVDVVDHYVGARLETRRKDIGMSQEELAAGLGVTFQQVGKYEKGVNRMSAGRLLKAARTLKVTVGFFFEGVGV